MKTIASLRVSTAHQEIDSQKLAILDYARTQGFSIDDLVAVTASGRASEQRRRTHDLMAMLERGDRLVVSELSRLGRSLGQIVGLLDQLVKRGIAVIAIKENLRIEGQQDMPTKVMTTLFALFAEIERDLIAERTKEGRARARAAGKKLGRPKGSYGPSRLDGKEEDILKFLKLGISKSAIAKIIGVSRPTLYHFIRTRGLKTNP